MFAAVGQIDGAAVAWIMGYKVDISAVAARPIVAPIDAHGRNEGPQPNVVVQGEDGGWHKLDRLCLHVFPDLLLVVDLGDIFHDVADDVAFLGFV